MSRTQTRRKLPKIARRKKRTPNAVQYKVKPAGRIATPHPLPPIKQSVEEILAKLKQLDPVVHDLIRTKLETVPISWSGVDEEGTLRHQQSPREIVLNSSAVKSKEQLAPILLHELIHAVGGTELDAHGYVAWVYPKHPRDNSIEAADYAYFTEEVGKFVVSNKKTGKVTHNQTQQVIAKFKKPKRNIVVGNSTQKVGCCHKKSLGGALVYI